VTSANTPRHIITALVGDSEHQQGVVEHLIIDGALCTLSAIPRGWSDIVLFIAMVISRLDDSKEKNR
jgi:hypothetical protein